MSVSVCVGFFMCVRDMESFVFAGKCHTTGAIRNLNVSICCIFYISFWIWYSFEVLERPLPDFDDPQWHKVLLFPGKDSTTYLAKKTMREFIKDVYKTCLNWVLSKVVRSPKRHAGRHMGVKQALNAGIENQDQLMLGGWTDAAKVDTATSAAKINYYNKDLPLLGLQGMAGCNLAFKHEHPRFTLDPAKDSFFGEDYVSKMYPRLSKGIQESIQTAKLKLDEKLSRGVRDQLEGKLQHLQYFFQSVQFMSKCLFQDMVLMKERFPHLSVWTNQDPFLSNKWSQWEEALKEHVASRPDTALTAGVDRLQARVETAMEAAFKRALSQNVPQRDTTSGVAHLFINPWCTHTHI